MNDTCCKKSKYVVYGIAIVGCFLILAALVRIMQERTGDSVTAARSEERRKNLVALQAEAEQASKNYAWQDQGKGLVRLPIERAMEIALKEWQDPKTARSNLNARVQQATAPAPEQPSEFE